MLKQVLTLWLRRSVGLAAFAVTLSRHSVHPLWLKLLGGEVASPRQGEFHREKVVVCWNPATATEFDGDVHF